jgi:hypothetical protein
MGLKDKAKGIWKRVSDLDDGGESVNSLSKEKERIPYKDISKKLKEVMKGNVDVVGRKIIIPSYYAIYFNAADRKMREEVEDVVCDELKEELYHDMRKINPEQNKRDLCIEVKTDATIENSEFRIGFHIKKAEPGEKIIEEETPVQEPNVENEIDYKETVIEQAPSTIVDDKQTVVLQRPTEKILYRLLIDSGEEKQEIEVTKKTITIGRSSKDDVCLLNPDFSISRSHATITVKDENYYLTPSGINGTLLNGQELELNEESKISAGDEIKIMNYSIKILL